MNTSMSLKDVAVKETVADIALMAGCMIAKGEIEVGDSRELVSNILVWAEEFMVFHEKTDWDTEDYISCVDRFSEEKLKAAYGRGVSAG